MGMMIITGMSTRMHTGMGARPLQLRLAFLRWTQGTRAQARAVRSCRQSRARPAYPVCTTSIMDTLTRGAGTMATLMTSRMVTVMQAAGTATRMVVQAAMVSAARLCGLRPQQPARIMDTVTRVGMVTATARMNRTLMSELPCDVMRGGGVTWGPKLGAG